MPETGTYDIEVIDVWEMTRKTVLKNVHGLVTVPMPGKEGSAILARKKDDKIQ